MPSFFLVDMLNRQEVDVELRDSLILPLLGILSVLADYATCEV